MFCHIGLPRFLLTWSAKLLADVPAGVRARVWYMRDGAPAHLSRLVRDKLSNTYHDRWIGIGGPTAWPPRQIWILWIFNCADKQLLLTMKRHFTIGLCIPVRLWETSPASLNGCCGPWWDMARRARNIMGDISSTYYKCIISAVTHKLNVFWTHVRTDIFPCFAV
jgi:hypothetical protein